MFLEKLLFRTDSDGVSVTDGVSVSYGHDNFEQKQKRKDTDLRPEPNYSITHHQ